MSFLSFESYPLGLNALIFVIAAALIWVAGTTLERYADAISDRTGLGQAFTGVLLLSTATSLPEVATTITAVALLNNPTLAVYNLIGGVALQTAILAVADRTQRQSGALTFFEPRFVLLMQGVGLLLLLQLAVAGVAAQGRPTIFSISVWQLRSLSSISESYTPPIAIAVSRAGRPQSGTTRRWRAIGRRTGAQHQMMNGNRIAPPPRCGRSSAQ
jgi:cation:H+ antiporter